MEGEEKGGKVRTRERRGKKTRSKGNCVQNDNDHDEFDKNEGSVHVVLFSDECFQWREEPEEGDGWIAVCVRGRWVG